MKLRWLGALLDASDLPSENPGRAAVIAVATVLMRHADGNGRNSYPSIETMMSQAGVAKRTARTVLRVLVLEGWLAVTANANQHRPTVYSLNIPEGAEEHPLNIPQGVPRSTPYEVSGGAPGGAPGGAQEHPDIRHPTVREEEEEAAAARLPDGRLAAALSTAPLDIFSAEESGASRTRIEAADSPNGQGDGGALDALDPTIVAICQTIAKQARTAIEPQRLARALREARVRTGWSDTALAIYCVEKLWRMGNKARDPSAFLAADLGRVSGDTVPSPRMHFAALLARLNELWDAVPPEEGWNEETDPIDRFERLVVEAGLWQEDSEDSPDEWNIKAAQIEEASWLARRVIFDVERSQP